MQSSVPQYIDIEDKIVGPFTWKHLGWLLGMGVTLLMLYALFDFQLFLMSGIPVAFTFLAFAFYRPASMPMTKFVFHAFFFLFRPKVSVWERPVWKRESFAGSMKSPASAAPKPVNEEKDINIEKLRALANILDRKNTENTHELPDGPLPR